MKITGCISRFYDFCQENGNHGSTKGFLNYPQIHWLLALVIHNDKDHVSQ